MAVVDTFLYPRTIAASRPAAQTGVGFQSSYAADRRAAETEVMAEWPPAFVTDIPASIQARREGQRASTGLPGDNTNPIWWVFIPLEANVPAGTIKAKDIITDDLGNRFTVLAPYCDSMGWRLSVETLEA